MIKIYATNLQLTLSRKSEKPVRPSVVALKELNESKSDSGAASDRFMLPCHTNGQ